MAIVLLPVQSSLVSIDGKKKTYQSRLFHAHELHVTRDVDSVPLPSVLPAAQPPRALGHLGDLAQRRLDLALRVMVPAAVELDEE